jgi:hypothetical protein
VNLGEKNVEERGHPPIFEVSMRVHILHILHYSAFTAHFTGHDLTDTGFGATQPAVRKPATLLLLGFGLVGLAGLRRKFKK